MIQGAIKLMYEVSLISLHMRKRMRITSVIIKFAVALFQSPKT